jgi:hypothetical protein
MAGGRLIGGLNMRTVAPTAPADAAIMPLRAGMAAAAIAALTVIPLMTAVGRVTQGWTPADTAGSRILDGSTYGALIGLAVGTALLITGIHPWENDRPGPPQPWLITVAAPPLAGATVGCGLSAVAWMGSIERGSTASLTLSLVGSVAFGACVGAAARLGEGGSTWTAAAVGGACGGFFVWLIANALQDLITVSSTLTYWRALARDPSLGSRFVRYGLGASMPATCVPLGIASADALRRLWRR